MSTNVFTSLFSHISTLILSSRCDLAETFPFTAEYLKDIKQKIVGLFGTPTTNSHRDQLTDDTRLNFHLRNFYHLNFLQKQCLFFQLCLNYCFTFSLEVA